MRGKAGEFTHSGGHAGVKEQKRTNFDSNGVVLTNCPWIPSLINTKQVLCYLQYTKRTRTKFAIGLA